MLDRQHAVNFNWWVLMIVLGISLMGIVTIYSANHGRPELFFRNLYIKQIYWLAYGLGAFALGLIFDYHHLSRYAYWIYAAVVLSLFGVLAYGVIYYGARRWIHLGPLTIQVSEFARLALIFVLAKFFETTRQGGKIYLKDLAVPTVLTLVPTLLIAAQPDLGTAMMLFFILPLFVVAVEIETRTLVKLGLAGALSAPAMWFFLKDYQKNRVLTLFNPEMDPLGAGYHTIQSKIAIGSGGFWGKGLFAGTQSRLNFLPEKHTDFIFSVYAEELGFLGVVVLMALYLWLFLLGLNIAYRSKDRFGLFTALGIVFSLFTYTFYNIGMTIGIFPITGIPLPFLSYGGSALITNFFAVGVLLNIGMRRHVR